MQIITAAALAVAAFSLALVIRMVTYTRSLRWKTRRDIKQARSSERRAWAIVDYILAEEGPE